MFLKNYVPTLALNDFLPWEMTGLTLGKEGPSLLGTEEYPGALDPQRQNQYLVEGTVA